MNRTSQLISDYLDDELDDGGVRELAALLRGEPSAIEMLVIDSFVHSQLHSWMNIRYMGHDILADAVGDLSLSVCSHIAESPDDGFAIPSASEKRSSQRGWLAIFAVLTAILLIGVSLFSAYVFALKPTIVAQLSQAMGCEWSESEEDLKVGSLLHKGQQLKLHSGRALVTLACGAQMMLEGPTSVALTSASKVDLSQGQVSAKVPPQAIGFTVITPSAHFVDLGTEFKLTLEAKDACELQVFDGLVELRFFESDGRTIQQRLRISEGSAIRFDALQHNVVSIHYDETQRIMP